MKLPMKSRKRFLKKLSTWTTIFLVVFISSCGFAYEKHVIGKYYIIGVDTKDDLSLSYNLGNGDYIGKAPGRILQYGFDDTVLVAKTQEAHKANPSYYVIDMRKDSGAALEETFRIGPLDENEYLNGWHPKLHIQLRNAK